MPNIDPDMLAAARLFRQALPDSLTPDRLVLFGSRARGDYSIDSDADIALIYPGAMDRPGLRQKIAMELAKPAWDVMTQTMIHIQPFPVWQTELDQDGAATGMWILDNIRQDGITLDA